MKPVTGSVFLLLSLLIFAGCNQLDKPKEKQSILKIMEQQEAAWNKADIEGFMDGYYESDSIQFVTSRGVNYGWNNILANYKKAYPGAEGMGQLTFDILDVKILSPEYAYVIGKFSLQLPPDNPTGHFTLLWKKVKGEWKIIADHSS